MNNLRGILDLIILLLTILQYVSSNNNFHSSFAGQQFAFGPATGQKNVDRYYNYGTILASYDVNSDDECGLVCVVLHENCVSVNVGPVESNGYRKCHLKSRLVTNNDWLQTGIGYTYFYLEPPKYTAIGCYRSPSNKFDRIDSFYRHQHTRYTSIPIFIQDAQQMVRGCASMAWRRNYDVFGIEFAGECHATYKNVDYKSDGLGDDNDWNGCIYNVGIQGNRIYVYEFD